MQKAVAYIAEARTEKLDVDAVLDDAVRRVEMTGKAAELTKAALQRNLKIADELGALDTAGLAEMKRGQNRASDCQSPCSPPDRQVEGWFVKRPCRFWSGRAEAQKESQKRNRI